VQVAKYWRPSLLLLADDFEAEQLLVHFCNDLKKGGVFMLGKALIGSDMHAYHHQVQEMADNGDSSGGNTQKPFSNSAILRQRTSKTNSASERSETKAGQLLGTIDRLHYQ
jgi:hypothetical protein